MSFSRVGSLLLTLDYCSLPFDSRNYSFSIDSLFCVNFPCIWRLPGNGSGHTHATLCKSICHESIVVAFQSGEIRLTAILMPTGWRVEKLANLLLPRVAIKVHPTHNNRKRLPSILLYSLVCFFFVFFFCSGVAIDHVCLLQSSGMISPTNPPS